MTAREIAGVILEGWRRSFVLPNYTPPGWWECDVWTVTRAGYAVEYEIKLSRADFKADAGKKRQFRSGHRWETRAKHDMLAAGDPRGPSRFWYVAPADLLTPEDLPAWAGLMEARRQKARLSLRVTRPAPRLHRFAVGAECERRMWAACYYRMHEIRLGRQVEELAASREMQLRLAERILAAHEVLARRAERKHGGG